MVGRDGGRGGRTWASATLMSSVLVRYPQRSAACPPPPSLCRHGPLRGLQRRQGCVCVWEGVWGSILQSVGVCLPNKYPTLCLACSVPAADRCRYGRLSNLARVGSCGVVDGRAGGDCITRAHPCHAISRRGELRRAVVLRPTHGHAARVAVDGMLPMQGIPEEGMEAASCGAGRFPDGTQQRLAVQLSP
eukprot:361703-Chlamydomonas_euryale.AAC.2